jgi:hypothetical protein
MASIAIVVNVPRTPTTVRVITGFMGVPFSRRKQVSKRVAAATL